QVWCMPAEHCFQCECFIQIIISCTRTVCIDVTDFIRLDFCIFQCFSHCACAALAVFSRCHNVVVVACHAVGDDFRIDFCSACKCVFQFVDDNDACSFTDDESSTVLREWHGCIIRVFRLGKCPVRLEACNTHFCNR